MLRLRIYQQKLRQSKDSLATIFFQVCQMLFYDLVKEISVQDN